MSFVSGSNTVLTRALEGIDRPPAVPNALDDEFSGNALDAKWSWLDQGGAVATVGNGVLSIAITETLNRMRGIYQAAPGGAFTIRAKVMRPMINTSSSHSTLFVGQGAGSSDDQHGLGWFNFQHRPLTWASPSSTAAAWIDTRVNDLYDHVYAEIASDGSTGLTVRGSFDGVVWFPWASQTIAYTPTIVGLAFGNDTGDRSVHQFGWFRRVA